MRWVLAGCIGLIGLFVSWIVAPPADAQVFDFSSCAEAGLPADCNNSDTGLTHLTYTLAGTTIGVSANDTLDLKVNGPGETGLGVFSQPAHEIDSTDLVTLDFSDLASLGARGGIVTISSLQTGEVGVVTDVLGAHDVVESDGTLSGDVTVAFSPLFPTVTITAANEDVLVASSVSVIPSITPIPEPAPAGMAGLALLAAMLVSTAAAVKYSDG